MTPTIEVGYRDEGIFIHWPTGDGNRRAIFMPVDHVIGLAGALKDCAKRRTERAGTCWAVTPDGGVTWLFSAEIGAAPLVYPMTNAGARRLAEAIRQCIDARDSLRLDLDQIAQLPETEEPPLP